jgi:hypothetical protein
MLLVTPSIPPGNTAELADWFPVLALFCGVGCGTPGALFAGVPSNIWRAGSSDRSTVTFSVVTSDGVMLALAVGLALELVLETGVMTLLDGATAATGDAVLLATGRVGVDTTCVGEGGGLADCPLQAVSPATQSAPVTMRNIPERFQYITVSSSTTSEAFLSLAPFRA